MGHIFYIFLLFLTTILIGFISKYNKLKNIIEWYNKFTNVTGKSPKKSDFRNEDEYNFFSVQAVISSVEFFTLILGLLTGSWFIFLGLLLLTIFFNLLLKPIEFSSIERVVNFSVFLIRIVSYVFLIINHFHLHLDVYQEIMK
jgi:hypothetical protein